jgi:hypothetical protein
MNKFRWFIFSLFVVFSSLLCADITTPQSHCQSQSQIRGFRKIPATFFLVETTGVYHKFTFKRIVTDAVTVRSGTLYFSQYISWDPEFKKLNEGEEYDLRETNIKLYDEADIVRNKNIDRKRLMALTAYCPKYQEFDNIDSFYEIQKSVTNPGKNDLAYSLKLDKRNFLNSECRIIETGDFDKFQEFLSKRQSHGEIINPTYDMTEILSFAKKLKNHDIKKGTGLTKSIKDPITIEDNPVQQTDPVTYSPRNVAEKVQKALKTENDPEMRFFRRNFIRALVFSILIEFLVLLLLFKPVTSIFPFKIEQMITMFITCAIATGFTISINWWVLPAFIHQYFLNLVVTELFAVFVEALVYAKVFKIALKDAILLSAACNFNSYFAGVLFMS